MKRFSTLASTVLALGLGAIATSVLLLLLRGGLFAVRAQGPDGYSVYHVAPSCSGVPAPCYTGVQAAVDAADDPNDVIKVATGTYTGVSARAGVTQVVYISKSVTIRGGYTTAFTEPPDPGANPTTLDAQRQGRVFYITGDPSAGSGQAISPTLEGLRITGGHVKASGGGICSKDADLALVNTTITSNSASYKGGGIYVWGGNVTLSGGQISHNTANGSTYWNGGGGMFILGSAILSGGQIISNSASHGGGLYVYLSNVTLSGGQIIDNSADWAGGGVFIWPGSSVTLSGGEIINNSAGSGGGVHSGGAFTLTNNIIAGNQADAQGAGLWFSGWLENEIEGRLLHNTIADNLGCGQGVYVGDHATLAVTNTIIVSHTVGITVTAGSTATLKHTLWHSNTTNWGGRGTITHSNDHTGDPAFVDPGAGDYHITSASAAINQGMDAGVDDDIDGDPRPTGRGYDLGADEFVRYIYLPIVTHNWMRP